MTLQYFAGPPKANTTIRVIRAPVFGYEYKIFGCGDMDSLTITGSYGGLGKSYVLLFFTVICASAGIN